MINIGKISLFWFAAFVVAIAADADTTANTTATVPTQAVEEDEAFFSCGSICGADGEVAALSTPDLVVDYNWNLRVPTCAGKSCETDTCSALELKLPTFQMDESGCERHQTGLQEAGCECSGRSSSVLGLSPWLGSISGIVVAATTVVTMGMLL